MGRTLPSITQTFLQEQAEFARFRRALRHLVEQLLAVSAGPPREHEDQSSNTDPA